MNLNEINNDENNNNSGGDNRGKFSNKLKKIRLDKAKKTNVSDDLLEENVLKRGGRNILKILLATPMMIYSAIKSNQNEEILIENDFNKNGLAKNNSFNNVNPQTNESNQNIVSRRFKVNKIKEIDVTLLKKEKNLKNGHNNHSNTLDEKILLEKKQSKALEKEQRIAKLQREILYLIKKKLVKNINELEVLQSELYILKEVNNEDLYLKKCQVDIKEIKRLLSKVKSLKEKYDFLKENVDFEYMLEYEDELLIDKILELKDLCSSGDVKNVIDNYRILDEYKFLYLKIDKLQENVIKYDEYKKEKEQELKKRDINFEKLKNEVYDVDKENERYNTFVKEQELFMRELEEKISDIDSREVTTYRIKGFGKLVNNSFKYIGLLLASPLKGLIPGIATQTIVTKNIIHNLYNNLEIKENKRTVYETIDYSNSINIAINNLDSTLSLVNSTLEDIIKLKSKFINDFGKYQHSFTGYRDTIKKINKMENAVLGSKIKIELMQQRMIVKERQNSDKMKKVKKMNSSMNN